MIRASELDRCNRTARYHTRYEKAEVMIMSIS
jgi:hypothetical protein